MFTNPTVLGIYAEARMAEAQPAPSRPVAPARRLFLRLPSLVIPHYHRPQPANRPS